MDLTTIIVIASGITVFIGAIKTLPYIWATIKGVGRFFVGLEQIQGLPNLVEERGKVVELVGEVATKVDKLSKELSDHMLEEERVRGQEKGLIEELVNTIDNLATSADRQVVEVAEAVFRQATFTDPIAYYIINLDHATDRWHWKWGNKAFFDLTGLNIAQAVGDQYWDAIHVDDQARVRTATRSAIERGMTLEIDFRNINIQTREETMVRVISAPLKNRNEETISYLCSMNSLYQKRN